MSALPAIVEEQHSAHTEANGHAEETLLGWGAEGWVYVSLTIFFILAIVFGKLPSRITGALDDQIAQKRSNLDEAARIRAEAQALLADAKAQQEASAREADAIVERAKTEASAIVARAEADTAAMVARRGAMAESAISAAERSAVEDLRRQTAGVAVTAARSLIAERHSEADDRKLADEIIASI